MNVNENQTNRKVGIDELDTDRLLHQTIVDLSIYKVGHRRLIALRRLVKIVPHLTGLRKIEYERYDKVIKCATSSARENIHEFIENNYHETDAPKATREKFVKWMNYHLDIEIIMHLDKSVNAFSFCRDFLEFIWIKIFESEDGRFSIFEQALMLTGTTVGVLSSHALRRAGSPNLFGVIIISCITILTVYRTGNLNFDKNIPFLFRLTIYIQNGITWDVLSQLIE